MTAAAVMPAQAGIQSAAAPRWTSCQLGIRDGPVKPNDDSRGDAASLATIVIARSASAEAIQGPRMKSFRAAPGSLRWRSR